MRPTLQERFEAKVSREPTSGCWLWLAMREARGYGLFWVDGRFRRAHRIAWQLYRGDIPADKLVCHHCDVPQCVNPDHLFLGTPKENSADMQRKGRNRRGEQHYAARLTWKQVFEIRKLLQEGKLSQREIGALYGVSRDAVCKIKRGKSWRQQPSPEVINEPELPLQKPHREGRESGKDLVSG